MSYVMNTLDRGKAASGAGLISAGPEATARNGVVMSVFPTPTSNISDFARYRMRDYARTVADLRQAHDQQADGPAVLALVNELTCLAEEILAYRCDGNGHPCGACCPASDQFFVRLTAHYDRIIRSNGQLDDAFFQLVESLPVETPRAAA